VRIGTSGWGYPPWRGAFYPPKLPHRRELEYLSGQLSCYALQRPSSYQSWATQTPDDFVFAVKGSRFITHMKKLREPELLLAAVHQWLHRCRPAGLGGEDSGLAQRPRRVRLL
jgi:uncharacterized protein YecE (DUF72 family)